MSSDKVKILSHERVREIYKNNEKPTPYIIKRVREEQELLFIGFNHSNDINNYQYKILMKLWDDFLTRTQDNRIVLTEGGVRPIEESEETAITTHGEPGLLTYLAHKQGIEVASPEPPRKVEADELADKYGRDPVILYYFLRQIRQWHRIQNNKPSIEEYMQGVLDKYSQSLGWDFDFSYNHLTVIYQEILGEPFDPLNHNRSNDLSNPTRDDSIVNSVSRDSSQYRDIYIAEQIINYWNEGKSIFAVFGSSHAYSIEPVLISLD